MVSKYRHHCQLNEVDDYILSPIENTVQIKLPHVLAHNLTFPMLYELIKKLVLHHQS